LGDNVCEFNTDALAAGERLLFIGADDTTTPAYVARAQAHVRAHPALRLVLHGFSPALATPPPR